MTTKLRIISPPIARIVTLGLVTIACAHSARTVQAAEPTFVALEPAPSMVWGVAISPDGKRGAAVGDVSVILRPNDGPRPQGKLYIWEIDHPNTPRTIQLPIPESLVVPTAQLYAVEFLPHGSRLAVGGGHSLFLVQARDGKVLREFQGLRRGVEALAVSRDGSVLASAGDDTVQFWDATDGRLEKTDVHATETISAISLTRDLRLLCAGGYASNTKTPLRYFVRLWDVGHRARDLQIGFPVRTSYRGAVLVGDDKRVVTVDPSGDVQEWSVESERMLRDWPDDGSVTCIDVSDDGRYVATAHSRGTASLWDLASASIVDSQPIPENYYQEISVSRDGRRAVVGGFRQLCTVEFRVP